MINKKVLCLFLLILCFLSISSLSAMEINSDDVVITNDDLADDVVSSEEPVVVDCDDDLADASDDVVSSEGSSFDDNDDLVDASDDVVSSEEPVVVDCDDDLADASGDVFSSEETIEEDSSDVAVNNDENEEISVKQSTKNTLSSSSNNCSSISFWAPTTIDYGDDINLYCAWEGYFDGYYKILKGNSVVYSKQVSGKDKEYDWYCPKTLDIGQYKTCLVDKEGEIVTSIDLTVKKVSTKVGDIEGYLPTVFEETLLLKDFYTVVGEKTYIFVPLLKKLSEFNEYFSMGTLKFSINGKTYTKKVYGEDTRFEFKAPSKAKTYKCKITLAGTNNYDGCSKTFNLVVKKATSKIFAKAKTFKVQAKTKKYVVTLKNGTGKVLKNKKLTLKVKGKKYTARTNKKGKATFKLSKLKEKGKFTAVIKFAGDKTYKKSSKKVKITVKPIVSKIVAKAKTFKQEEKNKKYEVTLKNKEGKVLKNKKLTLKVNGKTYSAKTNKKGKATFKLSKLNKKGKFTAVIKYAGDKTYKKSSKKVKITVKAKPLKLRKGQYIDWCHGGDHDHKTVWTKKYNGKSYVGTVKINGVVYKKYVKLYQVECKCKNKKYHKLWMKYHNQNYYSYQALTQTNSPKYVYQKAKYKTVTVGTKYDNYVSKYAGKYKVETYKWKGYTVGGLEIYLYNDGEMVPSSKYSSKAYYNADGTWRWGTWSHASEGYSNYHHYSLGNDVKVSKVKVKFMT